MWRVHYDMLLRCLPLSALLIACGTSQAPAPEPASPTDTGEPPRAEGATVQTFPMAHSAAPPDWDDPGWLHDPAAGSDGYLIGLDGDYGESFRVAALDLDQDGDEDYVVSRGYPDDVDYNESDLVIYLGGLSGVVSAGAYDLRHPEIDGAPVRYRDVDGDGLDDVLLTGVGVYSGRQLVGADPLTPADALTTAWSDDWNIGDANTDGFDDYAIYYVYEGWDTSGPLWASTIVWSGDPAGRDTLAEAGVGYGVWRVADEDWHLTNDRDGDGLRDLWAHPGDGRWRLYGSAALLRNEMELIQVVDGGSAGCNAGDLDGDGIDDLLVVSDGALTAVLASEGDADTATLPSAVPSSGTLDWPERIADVDGDGLAEFLVRAEGGTHEGLVRVPGSVLLTGGTVDIETPAWLLETTDAYVEIDPDAPAVWVEEPTGDRYLDWYARVPLDAGAGVLDWTANDLAFDPRVSVLGSTSVVVRWWEDGGATRMAVLGRDAPYGAAVVNVDYLDTPEIGPDLGHWVTWETAGPVGWLPDIDHDGEPEILLEEGGRLARWSFGAISGDGVELGTVESSASTDLVRRETGSLCDLDGDGVDDPISDAGPISGASVLDDDDGIVVLASIEDLGGCLGDLDGDGVGDLVSAADSSPAVLYSGAEAAAGRRTELYTWPDGAGPGTRDRVDANGDGKDDVPWVDHERAGWLAAFPTDTPTRTDFLLGVVGGSSNQAQYAWPADAPTRFGVVSDSAYGDPGDTQLTLYASTDGWQWWSAYDERAACGSAGVLHAVDDPQDAGLGILLAAVDHMDYDGYEHTWLWFVRVSP